MRKINCWEAVKLLKQLEEEQVEMGNKLSSSKNKHEREFLESTLDSLLIDMIEIKHRLEEVEITLMQ